MQTFNHSFLLPAMLIGSIDFYHFMPLLLTLTLGRGLQRQRKAKLVGFIVSNIFQLIRVELDTVFKQLNVNILRLLLTEVSRN